MQVLPNIWQMIGIFIIVGCIIVFFVALVISIINGIGRLRKAGRQKG